MLSDYEIRESVIGFEPLFNSMEKCKQGVLWKNQVAYYYLHGIKETLKLEEQLHNGTYKAKPPKEIEITHPKKRTAVSITYRDRIYQRSLNDNILYPTMTNSFIYENFACQQGKGTDLARDNLDKMLYRAYTHWKNDFYVLQCDIHGYYPNMRHDLVESSFKRYLPEVAYQMTEEILHNQYSGEIGYNPGSQMIQIAGISVLSPMDHFVKESLHASMYERYMDDFAIIDGSKEYLEYCFSQLTQYLKEQGFELNPKKSRIYHISEGVEMLGFIHKIEANGKVYRLISSANAKAERKKLVRMVHKAKKGLIPKAKVDESFDGWVAHAEKGNTHKVIQRMTKFYHDLWSEDNADKNT